MGAWCGGSGARDASRPGVELQGAGVIAAAASMPGRCGRLCGLMLNDALTPPFSANVLEKLSGDLYDLVYGQPFRLALPKLIS